MFSVNENYGKLPGSYLFSTVGKKIGDYSKANPDKRIVRLGIGDVTQPLAPAIIEALHHAVLLPRMTIKTGDVILRQMRFLFRMEPKVTRAIFRRFSVRTAG